MTVENFLDFTDKFCYAWVELKIEEYYVCRRVKLDPRPPVHNFRRAFNVYPSAVRGRI